MLVIILASSWHARPLLAGSTTGARRVGSGAFGRLCVVSNLGGGGAVFLTFVASAGGCGRRMRQYRWCCARYLVVSQSKGTPNIDPKILQSLLLGSLKWYP